MSTRFRSCASSAGSSDTCSAVLKSRGHHFESGVPLNVVTVWTPTGRRRPDLHTLIRTGGSACARSRPRRPVPVSRPVRQPRCVIGRTAVGAHLSTIDRTRRVHRHSDGGRAHRQPGRNTLRTPGINTFDFNILKRTSISEKTAAGIARRVLQHLQPPAVRRAERKRFLAGQQGTAAMSSVHCRVVFSTHFRRPGGRVIRYQLKFIF